MINTTTLLQKPKRRTVQLERGRERISHSLSQQQIDHRKALSLKAPRLSLAANVVDPLVSIVVNPFSAIAPFFFPSHILFDRRENAISLKSRSRLASFALFSFSPFSAQLLVCFAGFVAAICMLMKQTCKSLDLAAVVVDAGWLGSLRCWSRFGSWVQSARSCDPFHSLLRRQTGRTWFCRSVP